MLTAIGETGVFNGETTGGGVWGGQFYGTSEPDGMPGSVAGTFGFSAGNVRGMRRGPW